MQEFEIPIGSLGELVVKCVKYGGSSFEVVPDEFDDFEVAATTPIRSPPSEDDLVLRARAELTLHVQIAGHSTSDCNYLRIPTISLPAGPYLDDENDPSLTSIGTLEGELSLLREIGRYRLFYERLAKTTIFTQVFNLRVPDNANPLESACVQLGESPISGFGFQFELLGQCATVYSQSKLPSSNFPLITAALHGAPVCRHRLRNRIRPPKLDRLDELTELIEREYSLCPGAEKDLGIRFKFDGSKPVIAAIHPRWTICPDFDLSAILADWDLTKANLKHLNLRVAILRALGEDCSEELGAVALALVEKFKISQREDLLTKAIATGLKSREVAVGRPSLTSQLALIEARFWLDRIHHDAGCSGAQATFYAVRRELYHPVHLLAVDSLMSSLLLSDTASVEHFFNLANDLLGFKPESNWTVQRSLREICAAAVRFIQN